MRAEVKNGHSPVRAPLHTLTRAALVVRPLHGPQARIAARFCSGPAGHGHVKGEGMGRLDKDGLREGRPPTPAPKPQHTPAPIPLWLNHAHRCARRTWRFVVVVGYGYA